jgi:3-methyladenine DNA glycosylase AlkD
MTVDEVMAALEALGSEGTRRIWRNHGLSGPMFGVKVGDLKGVLKRAGKDHALALALWETGNVDARYLAGLMVTPKKMEAATLDAWARDANGPLISEYTVAWVAAESGLGGTLGERWIDDADARVASAGWATLACHVALTADDALDLDALAALWRRVESTIHAQPDRVRYTMNGFGIALGTYVAPLREAVVAAATRIGPVSVDQGGTACRVPALADAIGAAVARGATGKRKGVRC